MRAFLALALPAEARQALLESTRALRAAHPDLAWIGPENYHLTLAFLGEQGPAGIECARETLGMMRGETAPRIEPARICTFPPRGPWRVLVLELEASRTLAALNVRLNDRLAAGAAERGLSPLNAEWSQDPRRPGRAFRPHLSLARPGRRGDGAGGQFDPSLLSPAFAEFRAKMPQGGWPLGPLVLYKSELRREGAVYTELAGIDLEPAR